ncbi:amine oxidase-like protein [Lineolata rhizophorae]|uniref:Amine oxidase-like protein n=1 Tax=Lineolata rhizophorae TaxID=578093 RepID=A0A6A6PB42_9PEZI|nr:amine oxidase-like protein [Lineolata rhizophorae]
MGPKRIAVVGSGVSGLGAVWALKTTPYEVHLYEAADRLGGHTNTVVFKHNGLETPVDTGFIVLNTATYPNFIRFLKQEGIETIPSEMTFGVTRDEGRFEWSGTSLSAIFAQRSNLLRPSFWRMIFDVVRFNYFALDLLRQEADLVGLGREDDVQLASLREWSIGEYLEREGYSTSFRDDYLLPMTACVWSTGPEKCALEFPVLTLVRFLWNHHLLNTISERPPWLTIRGCSREYITAIMKGVPGERVHVSAEVKSVRNNAVGKVVLCLDDKEEIFDNVILACHGDQALNLIFSSATTAEKEILGKFKTTRNVAYLHSDNTFMPRRRVAWSAWNYTTNSSDNSASGSNMQAKSVESVSLTYNMNILQSIPTSKYGDILVTLNPLRKPNPKLTQGMYPYRHPLYNHEAVRAQDALRTIQENRGISYAGAWTGYGFHEDGFISGLRAATQLGAKLPWELVDNKCLRGKRPETSPKDVRVRVIILLFFFALRLGDLAWFIATLPLRVLSLLWSMTTSPLRKGKLA